MKSKKYCISMRTAHSQQKRLLICLGVHATQSLGLLIVTMLHFGMGKKTMNERYAVIVIGETRVKDVMGSVKEYWVDDKEQAYVIYDNLCESHDWVEIRDTHNEDDDVLESSQ